ncbi:MAG: hypothetical protein ABJH52_10780 [Henriciella sp.]
MINSVGASQLSSQSLQSQASLSEEQQSSIADVLAKYDPDNVSESDAQNIVSSIQELGISPGTVLTQAMQASGFDAKSIGDAAGVKGDRPPPPPGGGQMGGKGSVDTEALAALQLFLDQYEGSDITEEDWSSITTALEEQGFDTNRPFVDLFL